VIFISGKSIVVLRCLYSFGSNIVVCFNVIEKCGAFGLLNGNCHPRRFSGRGHHPGSYES